MLLKETEQSNLVILDRQLGGMLLCRSERERWEEQRHRIRPVISTPGLPSHNQKRSLLLRPLGHSNDLTRSMSVPLDNICDDVKELWVLRPGKLRLTEMSSHGEWIARICADAIQARGSVQER